jgi:hypothetical protein
MTNIARCLICDISLWASNPSALWTSDEVVCQDCARKTGIVAVPPPRRRVTPCAKCSHTKLVRVVPREITEGVAGPMFATHEIQRAGSAVLGIYPRAGYGVLEAYICKQCGFVEWYCQSPDEIPIGPEYMNELVDLDAGGPYR